MKAGRRTVYGMWAAAAGVGVILLTACGGGSSGSSAVAAGNGAADGASVTVTTHKGAVGTYLSDGKGRSLYEFANDKAGTSTCSGSCTSFWPPLTTTGSAGAGSGVSSALLGTTTRSDGSMQVTYAGHPLYYFVKDDGAGDTYGQGLNSSGGLWWLLTQDGKIIPSTGASPASAGDSSNGY